MECPHIIFAIKANQTEFNRLLDISNLEYCDQICPQCVLNTLCIYVVVTKVPLIIILETYWLSAN